jgi:hypothetical protein
MILKQQTPHGAFLVNSTANSPISELPVIRLLGHRRRVRARDSVSKLNRRRVAIEDHTIYHRDPSIINCDGLKVKALGREVLVYWLAERQMKEGSARNA